MWASGARWKRPWRRESCKAVVCTSTLDLGIDWGDVDLVIHVGAPKGSSRLLQRIGRSNHRLDSPSEALLVPSNRFEVLECEAALQAAKENAQDTEYPAVLKLDVLAQHILGRACAGPFRCGRAFCRSDAGLDLPQSDAGGFRCGDRLCGDRRLRAPGL